MKRVFLFVSLIIKIDIRRCTVDQVFDLWKSQWKRASLQYRKFQHMLDNPEKYTVKEKKAIIAAADRVCGRRWICTELVQRLK
jgi:hypothetical protein